MCFTSIFIMDAMPTGWHEGWGVERWKWGGKLEGVARLEASCTLRQNNYAEKLWSTIHIDYLLYTDYT